MSGKTRRPPLPRPTAQEPAQEREQAPLTSSETIRRPLDKAADKDRFPMAHKGAADFDRFRQDGIIASTGGSPKQPIDFERFREEIRELRESIPAIFADDRPDDAPE